MHISNQSGGNLYRLRATKSKSVIPMNLRKQEITRMQISLACLYLGKTMVTDIIKEKPSAMFLFCNLSENGCKSSRHSIKLSVLRRTKTNYHLTMPATYNHMGGCWQYIFKWKSKVKFIAKS